MAAKNLLFALLILAYVGTSFGGVFHFAVTGKNENVVKNAKTLKIMVDGVSSFTSTSPVLKWESIGSHGYRWPDRFEVAMKKNQNMKFVLIGSDGENLSESNSIPWESVADPDNYFNFIKFSNSYGVADIRLYMIRYPGAQCSCT